MHIIHEGEIIWTPPAERVKRSNMARYLRWLEENRGLTFSDYNELWEWSVSDLEGFWSSIWEYYRVSASNPCRQIIAERRMPGAIWFPGVELNFAEHILRHDKSEPAIIFQPESGQSSEMSWEELKRRVASVAAALRGMGVGEGDRVVAYLPNIPETIVAFLATASIGAIWSCCSPDFGSKTVLDRFRQIEPKVLFAVDGYRYNGQPFDRMRLVDELVADLPSVEHTVLISYLDSERQLPAGLTPWSGLLEEHGELEYTHVPFDHPLWVLYSSGTTGPPKALAQGHGGVLLGLLASLGLHYDLTPDDRYFWFTTTGWAVWNVVVSGLLFGSTIVLYDGSPSYPDLNRLWQLAADTRMTFFGVGTALMLSYIKAKVEPGRDYDLTSLRTISVTGSPMPPDGFAWIYEHVSPDVWFFSISGGTDSLVPLVSGTLLLPVRAGEIQSRCLGVKVEAWDERGRPLVDQVGEMVLTEPLPSMPLFLWNDPTGERYRESYFSTYPGVWRHGDWIRITPHGGAVIYGRSDATIKRMGVRIGSAEIYRVVDEIPEVVDSVVVDVSRGGHESRVILFVQLHERVVLDGALTSRIKAALRTDLSPRHVPDQVIAVPAIPRTLNNKKMEVPVKRILMGVPVERAVNPDSMSNPESLQYFMEFASAMQQSGRHMAPGNAPDGPGEHT